MKLKVNGIMLNFKGTTAADLVQQLDYKNTRIALEVNECIIPKSQHHEFAFNADDKVEIIKAVGGG